jgi:hypothetical protein
MVLTIHASDNAHMLWDRNAVGNDMDDIRQELLQRIQNYLECGGLINPEYMEHQKVRDLIVDVRDYLSKGRTPHKNRVSIYTADNGSI